MKRITVMIARVGESERRGRAAWRSSSRELINWGLDRIDVRGDWRLSHLENASSFRHPRSPSVPIFPRSFSPFHPSQLACAQFLAPWNPVGEGLRIVSARACPLDLLILLHLNFINFSTGPEDEKNRNSLQLCFFFHLHYPFVVRSDITPSHLSATRSHTHTLKHPLTVSQDGNVYRMVQEY